MNEEFEKWARYMGHPFCDVVLTHGPASSRNETEIRYSEMARCAWQASRKQAVEECAQIAEKLRCEHADDEITSTILALQKD